MEHHFREYGLYRGLSPGKPYKRCLTVYFDVLTAGRSETAREYQKRSDAPVTNLVWQEMGVLLASGAIGSLLVWGYQKWLKQ